MHDWVHSHSYLAVDRSEAGDSTCINKHELSFRWITSTQWGIQPLYVLQCSFDAVRLVLNSLQWDNVKYFHNKSLSPASADAEQEPKMFTEGVWINSGIYEIWWTVNGIILSLPVFAKAVCACLFSGPIAFAWLHSLPRQVCWFSFSNRCTCNSSTDSLDAGTCCTQNPCRKMGIWDFQVLNYEYGLES